MTTKRFHGPDPKPGPANARGWPRRSSSSPPISARPVRRCVWNGGGRGGRQSEVTQNASPWGSEDAVSGEVSP